MKQSMIKLGILFAAAVAIAGCEIPDQTPYDQLRQDEMAKQEREQKKAYRDLNLRMAPDVFKPLGLKVLSQMNDDNCFVLERETDHAWYQGCTIGDKIGGLYPLERNNSSAPPVIDPRMRPTR